MGAVFTMSYGVVFAVGPDLGDIVVAHMLVVYDRDYHDWWYAGEYSFLLITISIM